MKHKEIATVKILYYQKSDEKNENHTSKQLF